jgi:5-methylcytosine-specific restriction endonuclease McrA
LSVPSLARFKRCTKCGCTKPATREFFHAESSVPAGLRADCKVCRLIGRKAWYDANRDTAIRRTVECAKKNPNRKAYMAEYLPKWHQKNPNYTRDRWRRYREEKRKDPEWRAKELAGRRAYQAKRLAAQAAGGGECSPAEILEMYDNQGGLCAYCETPLFGDYHVDHMLPISRGGSSDWTNLAITCPPCNIRKHDKTVEDFWLVLSS